MLEGSSVLSNSTWVGIMAGAAAAVLVKFTEHFLTRKQQGVDIETKIREEFRLEVDGLKKSHLSEIELLRGDIKANKEEITLLKNENNDWRAKYYGLMDRFTQLNGKYVNLLNKFESLRLELLRANLQPGVTGMTQTLLRQLTDTEHRDEDPSGLDPDAPKKLP